MCGSIAGSAGEALVLFIRTTGRMFVSSSVYAELYIRRSQLRSGMPIRYDRSIQSSNSLCSDEDQRHFYSTRKTARVRGSGAQDAASNVGTPQATPTRKPNTPEKGHGKIRGYSWVNVSLGVSRQYLVKNGPSSRRQAVDEGHKWSCAPRPGYLSPETSFCKMEAYETTNK